MLERTVAPLQRLPLEWSRAAGVEVAVLRLDLLDPLLSGNKWFKLAPHWQAAQARGLRGMMSLGGAHSNHLHALAAAGQRLGFATVGLLRGHPQATPTVADLQAFGMQLHWLGYAGYRQRHAVDFWQPWQALYPHLLPVAEGGGGPLGAQGCAAIVPQAMAQLAELGWADFDGWWLACGTGTTLAGLVLAEAGAHRVFGAMAVPAGHGVESSVEELAGVAGDAYELFDASRGGFAKRDSVLMDFMQDTTAACGLPLEPVYTAKALLALRDKVASGGFVRGTRLVFVHTGGLQGYRLGSLGDPAQPAAAATGICSGA
jgi:1-aminocyclopropane-1-carboxylate deaminase